MSIVEAVLLSLVAVLAAYSGYAAAKWGTESSVHARQGIDRAHQFATRYDTEAIVTRTLDSVSFNAWFSAFVIGNKQGRGARGEAFASRLPAGIQSVAGHRPGSQPQRAARAFVHAAVRHPRGGRGGRRRQGSRRDFAKGSDAGETADKYIRDTVFLASVLFLVGISGHFRVPQARLGLIGVGAADPGVLGDPAAGPARRRRKRHQRRHPVWAMHADSRRS